MDHAFWYERWDRKAINFHQSRGNPLLHAHLDALGLTEGARVFLPLCGKTGDIGWLLSQGFRVAGCELSRIAVSELFDDLKTTPKINDVNGLQHHAAPGIDIFAGDIFALDAATLGPVDAVYDRAALVAMPPEMRPGYTAQLRAQTQNAPQVLITFEYDVPGLSGPPFSVPRDEILSHYQATHTVSNLADVAVPGGLKGLEPVREQVWHLAQRPSETAAA